MTEARFTTEVSAEDARAFAELSGDWNPLHTDAVYAATTDFGRPILHGAFSAGLISRLAGMELPGRDCLLLDMKLRFVAPIIPPVSLAVVGTLVSETQDAGRVVATVSDAETGTLYVDASYAYGRHLQVAAAEMPAEDLASGSDLPPILVTGATGKFGSAVMRRLGKRAKGVSRRDQPGMLAVEKLENIATVVGDQQISAIVHCAWPIPEVHPLLELPNPEFSIETHVAAPLRQAQAFGKATRGERHGKSTAYSDRFNGRRAGPPQLPAASVQFGKIDDPDFGSCACLAACASQQTLYRRFL